jgi:hypothetical protein
LALYAKRLHWAAAHDYRRAVLFIRDGNLALKALHELFGARYWRTCPMQWADGQTAAGLWYRIDLAAPCPRIPPARPRRVEHRARRTGHKLADMSPFLLEGAGFSAFC